MLGGGGTALVFASQLIGACLGHLLGHSGDFQMQMVAIAICVALFATSVYLGLEKGIKKLADINIGLLLVLLVFILLAGPTTDLLKTTFNALGLMTQNFIRMNTWTDAFSDSMFVESWTVFYWAWWIAFAPFVGVFVARISRGRTIKQVILGMLFWGPAGCALFFQILGNYALHLEVSQGVNISQLILNDDGATAVIKVLQQLPFSYLVILLYCVAAIVFCATTYNSASYAMASSITRKLPVGDHPARWHRVFWAFMLAILPISLIFVGGLKVVQTAALVVSLPILIIGVFMAISLVKSLKDDEHIKGINESVSEEESWKINVI